MAARHCMACGGKMKYIHMGGFAGVFRVRNYQCTQCHGIEWVMCRDTPAETHYLWKERPHGQANKAYRKRQRRLQNLHR